MNRIQSIQLQVAMASYSIGAQTLACCKLAPLGLPPSWLPAMPKYTSDNQWIPVDNVSNALKQPGSQERSPDKPPSTTGQCMLDIIHLQMMHRLFANHWVRTKSTAFRAGYGATNHVAPEQKQGVQHKIGIRHQNCKHN